MIKNDSIRYYYQISETEDEENLGLNDCGWMFVEVDVSKTT